MDKKYTKKIDYKRLKTINETCLNLSAYKGLSRTQNLIKYFKIFTILSTSLSVSYLLYKNYYMKKYLVTKKEEILHFLDINKDNKNIQNRIDELREKEMLKFPDLKLYYLKEADKGILQYRYKLSSSRFYFISSS